MDLRLHSFQIIAIFLSYDPIWLEFDSHSKITTPQRHVRRTLTHFYITLRFKYRYLWLIRKTKITPQNFRDTLRIETEQTVEELERKFELIRLREIKIKVRDFPSISLQLPKL